MITKINQILEGSTELLTTDIGKFARELGYRELLGIETAADLERELASHGPIIAMKNDDELGHIVFGTSRSKALTLNLRTGEFERMSVRDLRKSIIGAKFWGGNLMGYGAEGTFTTLTARSHGHGNYHGNHFAGFFRTSSEITTFVSDFTTNYEEIFSSVNIATVIATDYKHEGKQVLKFQLDDVWGPFPDPRGLLHHDYVQINLGTAGNVFARTLKRDWRYFFEKFYTVEKMPTFTIEDIMLIANVLFKMYPVNSRHFLAGKRSWKIHHVEDDLYMVETAGLERFSHWLYTLMGELGLITRSQIEDVWTNLLNNIATRYGITFIDDPGSSTAGYSVAEMTRGKVYHREISREPKKVTEILTDPQFKIVLARHPDLKLE